MARSVRRTALAAAAGVVALAPLVLTGPADAAQARDVTEKVAHVQFHDSGLAPGHTGNAHAGYFFVDDTNGTVTVSGFEFDLRCAPGVHLKPVNYGTEEQVCTLLHTWEFTSTDVRLTDFNAVQMGSARLVGDVTLTSRFHSGTPRTEHVDLTVTGLAPAAKYLGTGATGGVRVSRIQSAQAAGTFGPMVLGDSPRDNQLTSLYSIIDFAPVTAQ